MSEAGVVAITVALIASVIGPTVATVVTVRTKRAIGTPNGQGDLVQMVERMDRRLEVVDARTERLDERTADLVDSQAGQDRRIAALEATRPHH